MTRVRTKRGDYKTLHCLPGRIHTLQEYKLTVYNVYTAIAEIDKLFISRRPRAFTTGIIGDVVKQTHKTITYDEFQ